MAKIIFAGILVGALLCASPLLKAEETEKPLTNADVANMVKGGLSESTIMLAIQMAGQRESTNFDTSPGALVELKRQGATEKILNAVLWAQALGTAPQSKSTEIGAAPGLPTQPGVYFRGVSGWIALPSFLLWPPLMAPWNVAVGFARKEYSTALPGLHAQLQIAEPKPVFYVREPKSDAAGQLLRLASRKDHRELWLTSGDVFTTQVGFRRSDLQAVDFKALAPDVFTVRPKSDLGAGEYLYCAAVPGGHRLSLCYDFGISSEPRQSNRNQRNSNSDETQGQTSASAVRPKSGRGLFLHGLLPFRSDTVCATVFTGGGPCASRSFHLVRSASTRDIGVDAEPGLGLDEKRQRS